MENGRKLSRTVGLLRGNFMTSGFQILNRSCNSKYMNQERFSKSLSSRSVKGFGKIQRSAKKMGGPCATGVSSLRLVIKEIAISEADMKHNLLN